MIKTVCFVSDFFYPRVGGAEVHIFQVAQCLIAKGIRVIVVTRNYEDRLGVRFKPENEP